MHEYHAMASAAAAHSLLSICTALTAAHSNTEILELHRVYFGQAKNTFYVFKFIRFDSSAMWLT